MQAALAWDRLCLMGVVFIPTTFLHFTLVFLSVEKQRIPRKIIQGAYVISALFLLLVWTPWFVPTVEPKGSIKFFTVPGPAYHAFLVYFFITVWGSIILLGKTLVKSRQGRGSPLLRRQLTYLFWATTLGYVGGGTNYAIVYNVRPFEIAPFGNYAITFYALIVAYAIAHYRLLDARVATIHVVIFSIVFGLMCFLPLFLLFPAQGRLRIALWGGTIPVAFLIYRFLQKKAKSGIMKEEESYLKALEDTSREMPLIKDLDRLMETIVMSIVNNIGITNAALYLKNQEEYHVGYAFGDGKESLPKEIANNDSLIGDLFAKKGPVLREETQDQAGIHRQFSVMKAAVVIPCFLKGEMLGFLVLGEKKSGRAYNPEDLKAFGGLAVPLSLAMENAGHLKQLEALHAQALEGAKFRSIRQMMNSLSHEIGNLMMIACGKSQVLLMGKEKYQFNEEVVEMLKAINERGMVAAEILKEVKAYHDKSQKKEVVELDIAQTIEQSLERLGKLFQEIGVVAQKEISADLGQFQANESFKDFFYHLLKNSYFNLKKYKRTELSIQARRNGTGVEVIIQDMGGGFDRVMGEDTTGGELFTERGERGGVNVYLARVIAQDHGIELKIGTYQENGGQFIVRIPLSKEG